MTDDIKVGNGLKQRDGLQPNLFYIAMEYVLRYLSLQVKSTIFYESVHLIGYADDKYYGNNEAGHFGAIW